MTEWLRLLGRLLFGNERGVTLNTLGTTDASSIIPELWEKVFNYAADRLAIGSRLSGPDGSDAAVIEKTDLTKAPGDLIRFPLLGRLLGTPTSGTTELEGGEEKAPVGSFSVSVTYYRHATAIDKITLKQSLLKWPSDPNKLLSKWLARTLDDDWMNQVLNTETITNVVIYAGNKSSRANLQDGDVLTPTQLRRLWLQGIRRGVQPFRTTRFGQLPWSIFGVCMSEVDYYLLTGQDDFLQDVRLAGVRGDSNPALTGRIDMYKGMLIYPISSVSPGDGFLGSFLRPEARLAAAINSSTTSLTMGPTTAISNVDYNKYLPTSGTNTLRIGSEQISYTATPGDATLTVATRGANSTTAAAHTAGDLITLNNVGKVLLFGQNMLMRGWAQKPSLDGSSVANIRQERSYGFERGIGVDYMYGLGAVLSQGDSQPVNYAILETSAPNPNNIG